MIVVDRKDRYVEVKIVYGFTAEFKLKKEKDYYLLSTMEIDGLRVNYDSKTIRYLSEEIKLDSKNLDNALKTIGINDLNGFYAICREGLEKIL